MFLQTQIYVAQYLVTSLDYNNGAWTAACITAERETISGSGESLEAAVAVLESELKKYTMVRQAFREKRAREGQ